MTNLQAALGLAQLERINQHIERKKEIGRLYNEAFVDLIGFQKPLEKTEYAVNIYWVYGLIADSEKMKNKVCNHLIKANISSRPFFWCMHE